MESSARNISKEQLYGKCKRIRMFERYLLSRNPSLATNRVELSRVELNRYCLGPCMNNHSWWKCCLPRLFTSFAFSFDNFSIIFC